MNDVDKAGRQWTPNDSLLSAVLGIRGRLSRSRYQSKLTYDERIELTAILHGPVGQLTREQFKERLEKLNKGQRLQRENLRNGFLLGPTQLAAEMGYDEIDQGLMRLFELYGFPSTGTCAAGGRN